MTTEDDHASFGAVVCDDAVNPNLECDDSSIAESVFEEVNQFEEETKGYWAVYRGEIREHIKNEGLTKFLDSKKSALLLMEGMLEIDEKKRWNAQRVLKSKYFSAYYKAYYSEIYE